MECSACHQDIPPESRFCNHCGTPQPSPVLDDLAPRREARGDRRQISVMFCDLVESTYLAEHVDPEDLRELLGQYHAECAESISRLDGYVAQYLGDGILVYFGYPQAHEDDAERATRSAVEIQQRLVSRFPDGRVQARIGIHTGIVIVGEVGGDARREVLALGSATNIAARVQQFADPGGIAITDATYRQTVGVAARDLGERAIKGLDEPVRIYSVDRLFGGRRRDSDGPEVPLIGREDEVGRLREIIEKARSGQGAFVLVTGEPGIGKSRLVLACRDESLGAPRLWISARCSRYASGSAFRPVIDLFEERFVRPGTLGENRDGQSKLVADALGGLPGLDCAAVVPFVLDLLDLPALEAYPLPMITPEQHRERTMAGLCATALSLAERELFVLEVEDLHWADPSTLEFLTRLIDLTPDSRMVVLCTARPEFKSPWKPSQFVRVELDRLSAFPTLEMTEVLAAGRSVPAGLLREIAERSDGVPLFVEQLVRTVFESDWVNDLEDHVILPSGVFSEVVPATLRSSLMARIDRLGSAKRIAQLAATVGREFTFDQLARLAESTPQELSRGLDQLVDSDLVRIRETPAGAVYRFKHALLQDTAYDSQLRSDRRETHARVAGICAEGSLEFATTEPAVVARHYAEARLFDPAAKYFQEAGLAAAERYANDEATRFLRLALDSLQKLPEDAARAQRELTIRLAMASPLIATLDLEDREVVSLHERIAELCSEVGDGIASLPGLLYLSRFYQRSGALEESAELGLSILRIAEEANIPMMEGVGRLIVASSEITRSPSSKAIAGIERVLEVFESVDLPPPTSAMEPDLLTFARVTLAIALAVGGRFDEAFEQIRVSRDRADMIGHEPTRILVLALSTAALTIMTAYEEAVEWGREALELAEGRGFHSSEAQVKNMAGCARVATGDADGLAAVEEGLQQATTMGLRGGTAYYSLAAAAANRELGHFERAHEMLARTEETIGITGESIFIGRILRERAMILLAQGEKERARDELLASLVPLEEYESPVERLAAATEL